MRPYSQECYFNPERHKQALGNSTVPLKIKINGADHTLKAQNTDKIIALYVVHCSRKKNQLF